MFPASGRMLAVVVVLASGLTMAVGGDGSTLNSAATPLQRDNARHKQLLKLVAKGGGDVVFLGDSITERWESTGAKAWRETFAPLNAVNLGVGGDQTGHVLWRIREGKELEPLMPRVAVVLIGINNPVSHRPEDVAGGVEAIVTELKKQKPHIKVLVLGVFPCSLRRQDKAVKRIGAADLQPRVKQINAALARLHDGKSVFYKDIGAKFLDKDGGLSQEVMPDYLHLGPKGYQIWADAIRADVQKLVIAEQIQGQWSLQTRIVMGKKMDDQPGLRLVVSDGVMRFFRDLEGEPAVPVSVKNYRVDSAKTPVHFDSTGRTDWTEVSEGICRLEGDSLTLCFVEKNKPRPTIFATGDGAGMGEVLMTFKRVSKQR